MYLANIAAFLQEGRTLAISYVIAGFAMVTRTSPGGLCMYSVTPCQSPLFLS